MSTLKVGVTICLSLHSECVKSQKLYNTLHIFFRDRFLSVIVIRFDMILNRILSSDFDLKHNF